jgi:hypothetical protein
VAWNGLDVWPIDAGVLLEQEEHENGVPGQCVKLYIFDVFALSGTIAPPCTGSFMR